MEAPNESETNSDGTDDGDRKPPAIEKDGSGPSESGHRKSTPQKRKGKSNHALRWQEMYNRLCDYHKRFGHANVPNRYSEDPQLGSWVSAQRRAYKNFISGSSGSTGMTLERATKLKKLGFEWEAINPNNVPWETRYEELLAFVKKYGHANVPMRWKENVQLSNWVSKQRHDHKLLQRGTSSRLTEKRRKLLNDVGFIWEVERGSSIAQLQRVSVVGLSSRKPRNKDATSDGETSSNPSQSSPSRSRTTSTEKPLEGTNTASTLPSLAPNQQAVGNTMGAQEARGDASALFPQSGNAFELLQRSFDPTAAGGRSGSAQVDSNFRRSQDFQSAQGSAGASNDANSGQNQGATSQNFLGVNLPASTPAAANSNQQPVIILPILAMVPPNQGSAVHSAPAAPYLVPLAPMVQNAGSNNLQPANLLSTLQSQLGGNGVNSNMTNSFGNLFGGNTGNAGNSLGFSGASSVPTPAGLQSLLSSALGVQQPQAQAQAQIAAALTAAMQPNMFGGQQNQGAMSALSALLTNLSRGQQPPGASLGSNTTPATNTAPSSAGPPFAPGPAAPPDIANALSSTLSQFFQFQSLPPPSAPAQAPQPQPSQPSPQQAAVSQFQFGSSESAQNLASALSQFFQSSSPNTNAAGLQRRREDPEEGQPPEKRPRQS